MYHYLSIDTSPRNPRMFDTLTGAERAVRFDGARSFLFEHLNETGKIPISIYESQLPDRTQIICWYKLP
jgi:hypothetical protein